MSLECPQRPPLGAQALAWVYDILSQKSSASSGMGPSLAVCRLKSPRPLEGGGLHDVAVQTADIINLK